jgi:hypothetical protein
MNEKGMAAAAGKAKSEAATTEEGRKNIAEARRTAGPLFFFDSKLKIVLSMHCTS